MSRPRAEAWLSVTTTDRPEAFAALCADIADQARDAGVTPRLLVVENGTSPESRRRDLGVVEELRSRGGKATLDLAGPGGLSIAASRLRQRAQIQRELELASPPLFVWMLDDDVRLAHCAWGEDGLRDLPLHNHLSFLTDLASRSPPGVLVGEVTGDPPIPPIATLASRLADLECCLDVMFSSSPRAPWEVPAATFEALRRQDMYYDFSVDRRIPSFEDTALWLPRRGAANVKEACAEMLADAAELPAGVAFTRPILADPGRFDRPVPGTRRGANAVFFDVDVCVEHPYPSLQLAGVETRRSDMIGARILSARRPGSVLASGFSVLHRRRRGARLPSPGEVARSLLSDVLGAQLDRLLEVAIRGAEPRWRELAEQRTDRIQVAIARISDAVPRIRAALDGAPSWVAPFAVEGVRGTLAWAAGAVPGVNQGRLPGDLRDVLISEETGGRLWQRALDLSRGARS